MTTIEYTFEWPAGPKEVIVTGEFDDWKGTLPLVKSTTGAFELTFPVKIPEDKDKVFFKFIVDGDWVTSDAYNKGYDEQSGIENNYISDKEAKALSENPAEIQIPEAGGLPFVAAAATGAIKTEEPKEPHVSKEVTKTVDPVEPTPTTKQFEPTPGATPHVPIKTAEAESTLETPKLPVTKQEPEQARFKIVKRVRKNKKTGEVTILSEEKILLGPEDTIPSGTVFHEEEPEHTPSETTEPEENVHILPIEGSAEQTSFNPVAGEPGPVIPKNATEIKEFSEIRDVDAKALNERLNAEVEGTSATLDPKSQTSPSSEKATEPVTATEEIKKVEKEIAPAATSAKAPATSQPAPTKTSKKSSTKTSSPTKSEEKKKKTGFFSKVKKIFN